MNLSGYAMTEGTISSIKTTVTNNGEYLNLLIATLNKKNILGQTESEFFYKIPKNDYQDVLNKICNTFSVNKMDDLQGKGVLTLSSFFHTLVIIPQNDFKPFSYISQFEKDLEWVKNITTDPIICDTNFTDEEKINLAIIKTCLDKNLTKEDLDEKTYNNVNLLLLKNRLEKDLDSSHKTNKIMKI